MKPVAPSSLMLTKRLRATITIEVEASDYREAAEHQERLETHISSLRGDYPDARITLSERRGPTPTTGVARRSLHLRSGRLNSYE